MPVRLSCPGPRVCLVSADRSSVTTQIAVTTSCDATWRDCIVSPPSYCWREMGPRNCSPGRREMRPYLARACCLRPASPITAEPLIVGMGPGFVTSCRSPGVVIVLRPFRHPQKLMCCGSAIPTTPPASSGVGSSLEPLLKRFRLVICDEAFLPLVPDGEQQSLIPLVSEAGNLVVIRSLTKLYGIAGLRLGYAVAQPERLQRWAEWRDPWPVNGIAMAVGQCLLGSPRRHQRLVSRGCSAWTAHGRSLVATAACCCCLASPPCHRR